MKVSASGEAGMGRGAECPHVSVIVAVRNEATNIQRCLEQIFQQDYPEDRLELIVVDGQSDDDTAERAERFSFLGRRAKVLRLGERGRSQGLNRGILAARGEVIVRVDARTLIAGDYVSRCVETLRQTGADNVGGVQRPIANARRQEAIGLAQSHWFGVGNAQFRLGRRSGPVDSVYLGCFKREVFDKVGLFDEEAAVISEDSDINQRIRMAGGTVYLNKDIEARFYPRETFKEFWKLYYRYGGARAGSAIKHKSLTSWRQAVPPMFVLAVAATAVLSLVDPVWASAFWAIMTVYVSANGLISALIAFRARKPALFPFLIVAFACMHIGWALGFWRRLLIPERAGRYWGN